MKNKMIILIVFIIILSTMCIISGKNKINKLDILTSNECNSELKIYYNKDNKTIYTSCIDSITLNGENLNTQLKKSSGYYNILQKTINKEYTKISTLYDGGTTIFKKDNIYVGLCNTLDGNNNIYIGTTNFNDLIDVVCKTKE